MWNNCGFEPVLSSRVLVNPSNHFFYLPYGTGTVLYRTVPYGTGTVEFILLFFMLSFSWLRTFLSTVRYVVVDDNTMAEIITVCGIFLDSPQNLFILPVPVPCSSTVPYYL